MHFPGTSIEENKFCVANKSLRFEIYILQVFPNWPKKEEGFKKENGCAATYVKTIFISSMIF